MDYCAIWRYFGWEFGILSLGSLALKHWGIWRRFVQIPLYRPPCRNDGFHSLRNHIKTTEICVRGLAHIGQSSVMYSINFSIYSICPSLCISHVLPLPLPVRTRSPSAYVKGESRGTGYLGENCCFMRGDSLRTANIDFL